MKLYLSGPITALDIEVARANFQFVEIHLGHKQYAIVNPLKIRPRNCDNQICMKNELIRLHPDKTDFALVSDQHTWDCWMRHDIAEMMRCDGVAMLDDWNHSPGSRLEVAIATQANITCKHYESWS